MRRRFESGFARFADRIYHRKYTALCAAMVATLILSAQIPRLRFDTRDESFFHKDDPILIAYNDFRDTFGQDDIFIVALRPKNGLNLSFFSILHELHSKLEAGVPYLDDIQSLVNGRIVRAEGDTLYVEDLMKKPPENDPEVRRLMARIDRYPMYESLLVSADRSIAAIIIKARAVVDASTEDPLAGFESDPMQPAGAQRAYLSNAQNVEMAEAIRKIVSGYRGPGIDVFLSGTPIFVADIQKAIERDLGIMVPLSFVVIGVFLFALFRRVSGVVYPLLVVCLSLLSCIGIMAALDIPITNVIQILPTFLIVVGIGDSVHILTLFYRNFRDTGDKKSAVVQAVGFSGPPVLMTSVTTSCGLLSFAWADVASVAQLGRVASMGVMLAFFYTIVLLPALIAIFPIRAPKAAADSVRTAADRMFAAIAKSTCTHPMRIALSSAVVLAAAAYFASHMRLSHNALTWFPENAPVRAATELLNDVNGGTVMLEVIIDSGNPNGLYEPHLLEALDAASKHIAGMQVSGIQAGKAWSLADVIKEINRALHEDRDAAYTLPDTREAVAQELVLFESSGSDDLKDFADSTYRSARLSILAPFTDSVRYQDYVDAVESYLGGRFPGLSVKLTGHISLFVRITKHFITSMAKSYGLALLVITVLMVLMIGRIQIGLMSMAANVGPIICIFGVMGVLNIPLDMATILIGSIVLGLVVDDTIHFLHHFRRSFDLTGSVRTAVYDTLSTTGRALGITSMVLAGGFFIYTASYLANNIRFGLLAGTAVLLALAADFFLVPALLQMLLAKHERSHGDSEAS